MPVGGLNVWKLTSRRLASETTEEAGRAQPYSLLGHPRADHRASHIRLGDQQLVCVLGKRAWSSSRGVVDVEHDSARRT